MPPSSEPVLNYHPDLIKMMKHGPNRCPFCGHSFNLNDHTLFTRVSCNKCNFNPEIYDEKNTGTYNYIDFYINIFDMRIIVEVAARFLEASYDPEQHVFCLPLNQLNIDNIDQLISKLKTYIIFS